MDDLMVLFTFLLTSGLTVILMVILVITIISGLAFLIWYIASSSKYNNSGYSTDKPIKFLDLRKDIGAYGEYLTFNELKFYEQSGAKILHNCYLPKSNGETSEIDLLMIHTSGIYVIESKNYSGWIFGNEKQTYWTQTLSKGRRGTQKEKFYNPIMQNKSHIKWVEKQVGHINNIYSLIVFSERCTLKSVEVTSPNVWVMKRNILKSKITSIAIDNQNILSQEEVEEIYNKLVVYTGVSQEIKDKHIQNVKRTQDIATSSNVVINNPTRLNQDKTIVSTNSGTNNELICPKCGGKLKRKTIKQGPNIGKQYYQCDNNPQCDYERDL